MKNRLHPRYNGEILSKIGFQNGSHLGKLAKKQWEIWFKETWGKTTYADIKEDDYFILWNGSYHPVPFCQIADEEGRSKIQNGRPTRLLDGSFLYLNPTDMVRLSTPEECRKLTKEIRTEDNK